MKIKVIYTRPPITTNVFDYHAIDEDSSEPGMPIGWGTTAEEAIANLKEMIANG